MTTEVTTDLRSRIEEALTWLDSEQPEGALVQNSGIHSTAYFNGQKFELALCPEGHGGHPVLVVQRKLVFSRGGTNTTTFQQMEVNAILSAVRQMAPVARHWNGVGFRSISIELDRTPGPDVRRLIKTFSAGCRRHNRPICKCGWYRQGYDKALLPKGWA